jgi:hypothetical protein
MKYSTVYVTCPALVDCPARETPTLTTSIFPTASVLWGELEDQGVIPTETGDLDLETKQYFQQIFDDENISINDGLHAEVKCDKGTFLRDIPRDCFMSIFPSFCNVVDKHKNMGTALNFTGDSTDTGSRRKRAALAERREMMQTRAVACGDWQFEFSYDGTPEPGDCSTSCEDSMKAFGDECFDSRNTFREGTIDVGCSSYRYKVMNAPKKEEPKPEPSKVPDPKPEEPKEKPPTPLELKSAVCENEADFGNHPDVSPDFQSGRAGVFCGSGIYDNKVAKMSPGSKPYSATHKGGKVNYWYEVSWVEGCKTTVDSQDVAYPVGNKGPRCADIFKSAFKSCEYSLFAFYIHEL